MFIETAWHLSRNDAQEALKIVNHCGKEYDYTTVSNCLPLGGVTSRVRTSPRLNQTDETGRCVEGDPCDGECHPEASSILSMDVTSRVFMIPSGLRHPVFGGERCDSPLSSLPDDVSMAEQSGVYSLLDEHVNNMYNHKTPKAQHPVRPSGMATQDGDTRLELSDRPKAKRTG